MKKFVLVLKVIIIAIPVYAYPFDTKYYHNWKTVYHHHSESSYQHAYCSNHNGIEEYELSDKTRVDCLTDTHVIEFDFANKWAEALGQSVHYAVMTGKQPKVVIILDQKYKQRQMIYYERVKKIGKIYNIDVEYISDEVLNIDKHKHCQFKDCKCNRKGYHFWYNRGSN